MARGGARPGAGRPRGSRGERGRLLEERVRAAVGDDWCPVVFLCQVAADRKRPLELRVDCAKASAPYLAPRLKSIELEGGLAVDMAALVASLSRQRARIEDRGLAAVPVADPERGARMIPVETGVPRVPNDPPISEPALRRFEMRWRTPPATEPEARATPSTDYDPFGDDRDQS
jgi:hypothetical protein